LNIDLEAGYDLIGNASHIVNLTATNEIDLTASTINLYANVNRLLSSTDVAQPIIQYGSATGTGVSGSMVVSLPVAYTSATSYVAFASMMDTTASKISVNRDSASQITIYWSQAGPGSQELGWQTSGAIRN
jgi:hypothetical protein